MAIVEPSARRALSAPVPVSGWSLVANSRQAKYVACGEPWLKATVAAVYDAVSRNRGIVTSLGLLQWELALWAACDAGGQVQVMIPEYDVTSIDKNDLARRFGGHPENIHIYSFPTSSSKRKPKSAWPERDACCVEIADEIMPVSIRPEGNLERLLARAREEGKRIDERFKLEYDAIKHPLWVGHVARENLAEWAGDPQWPYLTHWTRTFSEPWPGETECDFFHDLLMSRDDMELEARLPRSAYATLYRIVSERLLRGGTSRIRNHQSAVAFTAQNPAAALSRMRYRHRFQRWNIEPYGLAIRRECLERLGAAPVVYQSDEKPIPESLDPVWIQGGASGKVDWSQEAEWRYPGDLDLDRLEPDDALILTLEHEEARAIQTISPWPVRALRSYF